MILYVKSERISNAKLDKNKAWHISTLQNGENPTSVAVTTLIFSINFPRLIKVIYTFSVKRQQFFPHPFQRQFYLLRHVFILKYTHMEREWEIIYAFLRKKNLLILFLLAMALLRSAAQGTLYILRHKEQHSAVCKQLKKRFHHFAHEHYIPLQKQFLISKHPLVGPVSQTVLTY